MARITGIFSDTGSLWNSLELDGNRAQNDEI